MSNIYFGEVLNALLKSANELETMLEPLERKNLVLNKASKAVTRKNQSVGMAVLSSCPEVGNLSIDEIKAWASRMPSYVVGESVIREIVNKLSNTEVVEVFWKWLLPQVAGDCIPFELAFYTYQSFCQRFGVISPLKRRYLMQVLELYAGVDGWVVPRSEKSNNPKAINVYGWMVLPEPYLDSLVWAMREDGWFGSAHQDELAKLVRWYPSQVTKPDFSATGGFFRREAYEFCLENGCTPRRWIRDNVLSDIDDPDLSGISDWKVHRWSEAWYAKMTETISAAYDEFSREVARWADKNMAPGVKTGRRI